MQDSPRSSASTQMQFRLSLPHTSERLVSRDCQSSLYSSSRSREYTLAALAASGGGASGCRRAAGVLGAAGDAGGLNAGAHAQASRADANRVWRMCCQSHSRPSTRRRHQSHAAGSSEPTCARREPACSTSRRDSAIGRGSAARWDAAQRWRRVRRHSVGRRNTLSLVSQREAAHDVGFRAYSGA
jgi:hypothetical protein